MSCPHPLRLSVVIDTPLSLANFNQDLYPSEYGKPDPNRVTPVYQGMITSARGYSRIFKSGGDTPNVQYRGWQFWLEGARIHRDGDKPAIIYQDGETNVQVWVHHGRVHRDGGEPAYLKVSKYSSVSACVEHGVFHRDGDKPAVTRKQASYSDQKDSSLEEFWFFRGVQHRLGGPAYQYEGPFYYNTGSDVLKVAHFLYAGGYPAGNPSKIAQWTAKGKKFSCTATTQYSKEGFVQETTQMVCHKGATQLWSFQNSPDAVTWQNCPGEILHTKPIPNFPIRDAFGDSDYDLHDHHSRRQISGLTQFLPKNQTWSGTLTGTKLELCSSAGHVLKIDLYNDKIHNSEGPAVTLTLDGTTLVREFYHNGEKVTDLIRQRKVNPVSIAALGEDSLTEEVLKTM